MSERTFARRFLAETGQPPGRFVARVRLDAACRRLEVAPRDYRSRFPALRRAPGLHARTRS